ncbi:MAG: ribosome silencing factor [Candidatus Latescibacterota bacterium]|nr:MAG: ribosome silencing factor [Candidatus Latescibacterota bacterium]
MKRPKTIAKRLVQSALSKKAEDVLLLDLRKITTMADFFIICSGGSDAQVKAIAEAVVEGAEKVKADVYHIEGFESLTWVLIDLVDIVVHIFQPDVRDYYQLERLWGDAMIERFDD